MSQSSRNSKLSTNVYDETQPKKCKASGRCNCIKGRGPIPLKSPTMSVQNKNAIPNKDIPTRLPSCSRYPTMLDQSPTSLIPDNGKPRYRCFPKPFLLTSLTPPYIAEENEQPTKDNNGKKDTQFGNAYKINPLIPQNVSIQHEGPADLDQLCQCDTENNRDTVWTVKIMKDACMSTHFYNIPAQVQTSLTAIVNADKLEMLLPRNERYTEEGDGIGDAECIPTCQYRQGNISKCMETIRLTEEYSSPVANIEGKYQEYPERLQQQYQWRGPQEYSEQLSQYPQYYRRTSDTLTPTYKETSSSQVYPPYHESSGTQTLQFQEQPADELYPPYHERNPEKSFQSYQEPKPTGPQAIPPHHDTQQDHETPRQACSAGGKPCQLYETSSQHGRTNRRYHDNIPSKKSSCCTVKPRTKREEQTFLRTNPQKHPRPCEPCVEASRKASEFQKSQSSQYLCPSDCPVAEKTMPQRNPEKQQPPCCAGPNQNYADPYYREGLSSSRASSNDSESKCCRKRSRSRDDKDSKKGRSKNGQRERSRSCDDTRNSKRRRSFERERDTAGHGRNRKKKDKCCIM